MRYSEFQNINFISPKYLNQNQIYFYLKVTKV